jgi:cyclic pyranopterin phosphate synthase
MIKLTHLDEKGQARMVDVGAKQATLRTAVAEGFVAMTAETLKLALSGDAKKGDVLAAARIAGIMAAKKTSELIPLCHPLALTKAAVDFTPSEAAVSVAALTVYDMLKAVDRAMEIGSIRLVAKSGGRSGDYAAPQKNKS